MRFHWVRGARRIIRTHVHTALLLVALVLLPAPRATAQTAEGQGPFDRQCSICHDEAGELLRDHADLVDGALVARQSGRALHGYLRRHFRQRSHAEISAIHAELLSIAQGGRRFSANCSVCHESAEALARDRLILRDDRLSGRYSGRDIAKYLQTHARIADAEEATFFEAVLKRQMARGEGE